jgi:acyl transferase domain-containing protein/NAD(P)-dependent dehydrogenase (short-subunit alcohol dehydrogenase family)
MGCRVAGAAGLEALRDRLASGAAPYRRVPPTRFDPVALAAEGPAPGNLSPWAALLDDVALDWRALRVPPLQVERLHQCEKVALQTMCEALADAGMKPGAAPVERGQIRIAATTLGPDPRIDPMRRIRRHRLATPIGEALARVAPARREQALAILDRVVDLACPPVEPDSFFTSASIVAGRAANLFDFRGGHLAIDVGTASSLAAVADAVEALERGECDVALVCAVAPLVTPSALLAMAHRGELAEAAPRPFDPEAAGTLLGEGAAAVVLKREADAAGDRVYALIEGIAGAAEPGAEEPGALGRCVARAAREALDRAGASADGVAAVASRAAGLPSDRLEAAGLAEAYAMRGGALPVGSCVPATGFLQGATGLVALVQAALAIHHREWTAPEAGRATVPAGAAAAPPAAELRRVAVSDGGPEPVAYHAVLAAPGPRAVPGRRARRGGRDADGIAVVGVGLVVPGANDVETYWRNVLTRADPVEDLPRSRFDVQALVGRNAELAHAFRTRLAAIVRPPPFDPARYDLSAAAAESLDPAVPLALLASEQALRDARWDRGAGRRGQAVFGQLSLRAREAGIETRIAFGNTLALAEEAMREAGLDEGLVGEVVQGARAAFDARGAAHRWPAATEAGTGLALTARVAAAFGLGGVPLTVDAACASSLAAVLAGSEALVRGEVDVALAGGVAYNLLPEYYVGLGLLGALSPRGGLPFHADAEGFVPAEGAAAVVLKRLRDARADGDRVYAVLRGHGVSSDGRGLSIYSPSTTGQQLAIRRALDRAGIAPETVDLVETHGPGTRLGDRTEVASYAAVYGGVARAAPLALSASKSQVGHATSAAGLVALVRAALALDRRVLPPSNASGEVDPELRLEEIPAALGIEPTPWAVPPGRPRRAAVSAFGMAGANHHLVLEEAPGPAVATAPAAAPPVTPLEADRFVVDLVPVTLPDRPPRLSLRGRHAILLGEPDGPAAALGAALRARGASPLVASRADLDAALAACPEADLFVDLSAFRHDPGLLDAESGAVAARARRCADDAFALLRSAYERLAASTPERPVAHVAVTSLGGDLGLSGGGGGNVLGAFQHGLALALKQEVPAALVKALDFDPLADPAELARAVVAELEDGNERVQVGFAGRRFVASLRREPLPAHGAPLRSVGPGDVFVFSGGGRGVVFECACAVARLGAVAVVTGRTALPDPALPHVGMDDAAFAEHRRREIVRRRGEPGLTPVRFAREMDALARDRELHRNLARARAEGLAVHYEACDVADRASVQALVERVRARHGRIDYLGHGAMVERSASVPRKTDADVAAGLDVKVAGLLHLLDATEDDPLRAVVAFGSGVARFGNRGQTDYAGANALLAAILPARAARRARPVHCVTVDWPAWRQIGWAASNADVAAGLDAAGVTSISPHEGRWWFLSELLHGTSPEVLLVSERMLHAWPFLGVGADGVRPAALVDDRGTPLVAGAFPLVDAVVERGPERVVTARRLDGAADPVLVQHRVDGRPILPGAFALEMLAEAAALARPGEALAEVSGFRMEAPVALVRRHLEVGVEATPAAAGDGTVEARLFTRLAAVAGRQVRVHARATFRFAPSAPEPRAGAVPEGDGVVRARSFYQLSRDPVELGPLFCRARWVELRGAEACATIEPFDPRQVAAPGGSAWPAFQVDPLLLDSAFQVAGSLEGYGEGWVCVPVAFERLRAGRRPRAGERARVRAVRVGEESPRVLYDLLVVGDDGAVLLEVAGLELRRVAAAGIAA